MKLLTFEEITKEIDSIINANPIASSIGIVTNDYCGEKLFFQRTREYFESQVKTNFISVSAENILIIDSFIDYLSKHVEENFSFEDIKDLTGINHSDLILNYLNLLNLNGINRLVILIENLESLSLEDQYHLLSQFRNVREKNKTQELSSQIHSIITGKFSYFEQLAFCNKYGTSFVLDDILYFEKSSLLEVKKAFLLSKVYNNLSEFRLELINEIADGTVGLISYLLENLKEPYELIDLINKDSGFEPIKDSIVSNFSILKEEDKSVIKDLINYKIRILKFNDQLERLYLSGLIQAESSGTEFIVKIRSWIHQVILREIFSEKNGVYFDNSQFLPPCTYLNTFAFKLIMEIENTLRNLLIAKLSEIEYQEHPLTILNCLGKYKKTEKGKEYYLFDWCVHKVHQTKSVYNINIYEALVSQLDLKDLEKIFLSNETIEVEPYCSLNSIFVNVLPEANALANIFSKLRNIRNPIAHNNLINVGIVEELTRIKKQLVSRLKT